MTEAVMPVYLAVDGAVGDSRVRDLVAACTPLDAAQRDAVRLSTCVVDDTGGSWSSLAPPSTPSNGTAATRSGQPRWDTTLRSLRERIPRDVEQVRAAGPRCFRPLLLLVIASPVLRFPADEFAELTAWDAASGRGLRTFPVVVPIGLGSGVTATLPRLVHPDRSRSYDLTSSPDPGSAAVALVAQIVTGSARDFARTSRHALPEWESPRRVPDIAAAPPPVPSGPGSASVPMRCNSTRDHTVGRFERRGEGWALVTNRASSGPSSTAPAVELRGGFYTDPGFAGCARCGATSFVRCGTCGQLGCWNSEQRTSTCAACHTTGPVEGQIDRVSAVD